jgi:hypothetical protein
MAITTNTTRPATSSDIVVPFSEIATLLSTRLSDLELNDLLARLVGSRSSLIQPGDLITADWAMSVEGRIAALERGGSGLGLSALSARAVRTLFETFDAYARLGAQRSLLPDGTGVDAVNAALGMTTAIQNVMLLAAASAGLANNSSGDSLVDIFGRLYTAQRDLTTLFSSNIPGVSNPGPRLLFAERLLTLLDNNDAGALSLRNAVAEHDIDATLLAQNRVNGLVATESGEVIIGTVDVSSRGSTRGNTLVIGDTQPFGFFFRVTNRTNRTLRMQLAADFLAPREAWSTSVAVVGGTGQVLELRPFNPANPLDPAALRDVQVNVTTPPGAVLNETGTLRLRASSPAPALVGGSGTTGVQIGNAATPPQPTTVRYQGTAPVIISGNPGAAAVNSAIEMRFDMRFTTTTGATTRDFRMRVNVTSNAAQASSFFIGFPDAQLDAAVSTPTLRQTTPFPLTDGQARSIRLSVIPQTGASGRTLNITVTIEAVADTTVNDSRTVTITAV